MQKCPINTAHNDEVGATSCKQCPPDRPSTYSTIGNKSIEDCKPCQDISNSMYYNTYKPMFDNRSVEYINNKQTAVIKCNDDIMVKHLV